MQLSKVMLISIFITTIILGVIGGVVSSSIGAAKPAAGQDAVAVAVYQQREQAYNQLIEQANSQLEKANAQLQALQGQGQQPAAASASAVNPGLTAEQASQVAVQAVEAGQTPLKPADLVSFEGKAAYEVAFAKGSVYVDAQSGAVIFNGTVAQTISADQAVKIAEDYLKDRDVLQVDQIPFRGAQIYRVVFKSGMMVYMDLTGQITYIQKASTPAPVLVASAASSGSSAPVVASAAKAEHEDEKGD